MKPVALLTALLVAVTLYAAVFERDRLLQFAGIAPVAETGTAPETDAATETVQEQQDAPAPQVAVVAIDSAAETVRNAVRLRGETEAARRVQVMAETSGLVISEPLRKGALVETGDELCRIEPGTRAAALAEAEAALAEAQINEVAAARLAEGGFGSETRKAQAEAALEAAQAAVLRARTEIDRLTITAPFSGTLETDAAELGTLLQPGSPCAEIIQLDPIRVVGYLPETLVAQVEPGAPAGIALADGRTLSGTVSFLARSADPDTRTFRVEIALPNPDLAIRDGQSASIEISAQGQPAHFIPSSALTLDNVGAMGVRIVDADSRVGFVPVRILRDTPQGVWVAGLPETARIIVVGQEFVTEGVTVDVTLREDGA